MNSRSSLSLVRCHPRPSRDHLVTDSVRVLLPSLPPCPSQPRRALRTAEGFQVLNVALNRQLDDVGAQTAMLSLAFSLVAKISTA